MAARRKKTAPAGGEDGRVAAQGAEVAQGRKEATDATEGKRKKPRAVRKPAAASTAESAEQQADNGLQNHLVQGRKADALAAIAACDDAVLLTAYQALMLKGDWRRAAVARRIEDLRLDEGA